MNNPSSPGSLALDPRLEESEERKWVDQTLLVSAQRLQGMGWRIQREHSALERDTFPNPHLALASQPRTNIHGQVHPEVHVLGPGLLHWVLTHHGEDAAVQVGLASCLVIPGHSNDGGSGAVPSHLMCRPEMRDRQDH